MKQFVVINFYEVPTNKIFRYNFLFWKRTQQNHAVCMAPNYGATKYFDTVAKVAITKEDLPKNVKPLNLELYGKGKRT